MKKETERFFVEWFVDKIGWDNSEVFDDERPDFKIKFPDKIIGLEVTNLYKDEKLKGSLIKRNEEFRNKWLLDVSEQYYAISKFPIKVQVLIKSGELDGDPGDLAFELSQKSDTLEGERAEFDFKPTNNCNLKISFLRLPDKFERYNRWDFIDSHVGFSRPIDESVIRDKIKNKATKLPSYKKKYNEIILLIVLDRTFESGMFHAVNDDLVLPDYGFSSVYLAFYPEDFTKIG